MFLNKFSDYYRKFEVYISVIGFSFGLIFTFLTLTRVDAFWENFWIIINLLIVAFGILAMTLFENKAEQPPFAQDELRVGEYKFHFYLTLLIQFAFGGLFATYFVFYVQSASFSDSWLFILILLFLLIGNEVWKKYYERLSFQISFFFLSLYLFLTFLLPVIFHRLGADLFVLAGILSLIITFFFTLLLRKFSQEKFKASHNILKISLGSIFILMNVLYFTDIIPPIPLSLNQAGVYHSIVKDGKGNYLVESESSVWQDYFKRYPVFHKRAGETVYVFSAIFSPIKFATEIVHQWQYYDEVKKEWIDSSKISLPITGGRAEGYRTYSLKYDINQGYWRVKVLTSSGQTLGKINFRIEEVEKIQDHVVKTM